MELGRQGEIFTEEEGDDDFLFYFCSTNNKEGRGEEKEKFA
jgi:hypothetical protein